MTVRIVTDSAAAIPDTLRAGAQVEIVPLRLHVDDDTYLDGELPPASLGARLARGDVATAAPSTGDFLAAITRALSDGPVLVLTVASSMSASHQSATIAARMAGGEVAVVDTRTAAGAQGLVVLAAARAAAAGASLAEVRTVAQRAAAHARMVAVVPDLARVARSGRVPVAAGWLGHQLGVRVLFELRGGRARFVGAVRSDEAAAARMIRMCERAAVAGTRLHVAVMQAGAGEQAGALAASVARLHPETCYIGEFSPAMVAHTGPGLVGLAWWYERASRSGGSVGP